MISFVRRHTSFTIIFSSHTLKSSSVVLLCWLLLWVLLLLNEILPIMIYHILVGIVGVNTRVIIGTLYYSCTHGLGKRCLVVCYCLLLISMILLKSIVVSVIHCPTSWSGLFKCSMYISIIFNIMTILILGL